MPSPAHGTRTRSGNAGARGGNASEPAPARGPGSAGNSCTPARAAELAAQAARGSGKKRSRDALIRRITQEAAAPSKGSTSLAPLPAAGDEAAWLPRAAYEAAGAASKRATSGMAAMQAVQCWHPGLRPPNTGDPLSGGQALGFTGAAMAGQGGVSLGAAAALPTCQPGLPPFGLAVRIGGACTGRGTAAPAASAGERGSAGSDAPGSAWGGPGFAQGGGGRPDFSAPMDYAAAAADAVRFAERWAARGRAAGVHERVPPHRMRCGRGGAG